MNGRLKLKSIYPTFEEFSTFCMEVVTEFYPRLVTDMPNLVYLKSEIERYVFKPLYRQFKNATCRYLPTEEGIEAFNNQFSNQLEEVVFDFLVYTSTNLHYFNESYTKVGENLEQGVNTYNSPINQDITNTKSNTTIAKGATAQSINLMVYNGNTSWLKAFSSYYTPQRKAELIDKFRWLFITFYAGCEEGVTLIELTEALSMADGDMIITPGEAEILRKIIIKKPDTLIPENIKRGINIGGVIGTFEEGNMVIDVYSVVSSLVTINSGSNELEINDTELGDKLLNNDYDFLLIEVSGPTSGIYLKDTVLLTKKLLRTDGIYVSGVALLSNTTNYEYALLKLIYSDSSITIKSQDIVKVYQNTPTTVSNSLVIKFIKMV